MEFIPEYQQRANGNKEASYPHDDLKLVLKDTHGIVVYQEQLMQMTGKLAGYSAGKQETFRKAVGKKDPKVMLPALELLEKDIVAYGHSPELAKQIVTIIHPFLGYGFNKSHSAAYAYIAYQTAYFKTYHPSEFFAALMTVFADEQEKVIKYIANAKSMGINLLPPDINLSGTGFTIEEKSLRFGLASIKGLGSAVLDYIAEHRPFPNIQYIVENVPKKQMNKKAIEVLCLTGAFDNLDIMEIVEEKVDAYPNITNRMHLFQHVLRMRGDKVDLTEEIKAFDHKTLLNKELELLGLYISGHPLDDICTPLDWDSIANFDFFETAGIVTSFKETVTKKGAKMAFVNIDTSTGKERIVLFPMQYERLEVKLQAGLIIKMKIQKKYDAARDEVSYIADRVQIPKRINKALLS